jgi:hypothetical protein
MNFLNRIGDWLDKLYESLPWRRAANKIDALEKDNARYDELWSGTTVELIKLEARHKELNERFMWLRAQIMNLRVSQAAEGRTGWEVMCYIPEEVVKKITEWEKSDPDLFEGFMFNVARPLVRNAIKGVVHVNKQGRVNALVFEPLDLNKAPRAPKWVMALFEKDGEHKFSKAAKVIDPGTEEERTKRASGL